MSGTSVVKEAQLLRHLVDKGLVEAADVPGEKVRFTVTSVGQAHPELAPLIREAQLFDLAQTKAREAQAMRRAPSMPIAEAQGILGRIPQIKRAFEDLWGRRETPGHQRLLDANLFRPHARAFKALETAGVLKIEGNRFRANQVALSLTDEGKRSSIISMLAV